MRSGYFGRNSMMCIHGCEDGKCEQCYDDFVQRGIRNEPVGTFGEVEEANCKKEQPEPVSVVEEVRCEVVAEFMARSAQRHRYD